MENQAIKSFGENKMKKIKITPLLATILVSTFLVSTTFADERNNKAPNPQVLPINSQPFGQSYAEWAEDYVRWVYSIPSDKNPFLTKNCTQPQHGKVWFIGGGPDTSCEVPKGKAIFVPIYSYSDTYPCPEPPIFKPAPGQSLEEFLTADAQTIVDGWGFQKLELIIDGKPVVNGLDQRVTTHLFKLTGDPSLKATLDGCVTGKKQWALADGYWAMIVGLSSGLHTLHFESIGGTPSVKSDIHLTIEDD
ncbi:MAG: hypothetical protein HOP02_14470 [Methylococcaceae bacterium]|nr:hypothetical protein [Methylococcaceae bacterium]